MFNASDYSILLVEDNPDHLNFEKKIIEKLKGISMVNCARNTREARKALEKTEYDLIVLDYDLPDSDGLVFLETLHLSNSDIPVVMVTGLGSEKVAVRAMKLGAYDYVVKDKDYLKNLPDIINRSLEKLRLSRSLKRIQEQLKKSEERYTDLYENANSGFVSVDINTGSFKRPNKKMLEITGYQRYELERMKYYELANPNERDRIIRYHENRIEGIFGTLESPEEFEFWINTRKQGKKYVNCTVTMFPNRDEIFMTFTDITDRKMLEDQLTRAHEQLKQHTLELENEVDLLKKKLVIEPALESRTDTEQKYDLDFGCSYLIKEPRPGKSYEIFKDLVSHGVFGLVITRTHPKRIQKIQGLEKTPIIWLAKSEEEETSISGANLGSIFHTISEFINKSEKSVVILDGLEYLVTVNDFDRTIQFLYDLQETIMVNDSIMVIPVNPDAVEKKELAIMERSTEEVEMVSNHLAPNGVPV